jgi:hypothetical protein
MRWMPIARPGLCLQHTLPGVMEQEPGQGQGKDDLWENGNATVTVHVPSPSSSGTHVPNVIVHS